MNDENKTKDELIKELDEIRQKISELKGSSLQQKECAENISSLKKQIEFILGATKTGLDIIDPEYNIRYIDPEWEKIYGSPQGKKCYEYFMDKNEVCPACGIERALETESTIITEELLPKENNRPIEVVTIPFQNSNGEWLVAEVNIDISERKKAENALRKAKNELEVRVEERTAELKNINAQLMQEVTERERAEKRLRKIYECFLDFGVDPLDNINRLVAMCGEIMGATCALYNRLYKGMLCSWGQWNVPSDYNPIDKPEGHICYDVITDGSAEVVYIPNLSESRYADTDSNVKQYNLKTYIGKAVKVGTESFGSLCVVYQGDFVPSEDDNKFMSGIASAIGVEEKRRHGEEAARESEGNFKTLAEQSPNMIFINCNGKVVYANRKCEEIMGYTKEEFYSDSFSFLELIVPEFRDLIMENYRKHSMGEEIPSFEYALIKKSGEIIETIISTKLINYKRKSAILGIITDISERKHAENALRESEKRYRSAIDSMVDPIHIVDSELRIIILNKAFKTWNNELGLETDIIGRNVFEVFPFLSDKIRDEYRTVFDTGIIISNEECVKIKDREIFVEARKIPIFDKDKVIRVMTIIRDITMRRQVEDALIESERKYRDLYDNAPDMYHTLDRNGVIIDCNETEAMMLGYNKKEIIGRHLTDFFTADSRELFKKDFPRLNHDKMQLSLERDFVRKDGSVFNANLNVFSEFDENGKLLRTKTIARDITRRKQAEDALRDSEIKYRSLFENSRDAIYITNRDGSFVDMNQSALDLFGFTKEELFASNILQLYVNPEDRTRFQSEVEKNGYVKDFEVKFRKIDGTEITCLLTATLRKNTDGSISGYQGIFRDVTEKRKNEEELLKFEKLESLGILAGGIAHDFNNILTTIMGNVSLALMHLKPEDQNFQRLVDAEKASLRARDLTQQLLTFSRGGAPIRKTTSIKELIKESAGFALRGSNVRCEISIPDDIWTVKIDEGQISQVIHNLVMNADQAMPEGGLINITAVNTIIKKNNRLKFLEGKYVKTTIRDHGVGIPEGYINKIFDPYFTTKQKGSGLGLAISFSIINKHEGYIVVESGLKNGTSFHIYLPASEKQTLSSRKDAQKIVKGNGKILVMDDDESIRVVLGYMLTKLGYSSGFAKDGKEAIDLYRKAVKAGEPYDAVMIDLTIPGGMGGREAIQKLLQIDPKVKAIVSSGYSNDPVMAEYEKHGFKDVIAKPYKTSHLSKVLHKVLTKK